MFPIAYGLNCPATGPFVNGMRHSELRVLRILQNYKRNQRTGVDAVFPLVNKRCHLTVGNSLVTVDAFRNGRCHFC